MPEGEPERLCGVSWDYNPAVTCVLLPDHADDLHTGEGGARWRDPERQAEVDAEERAVCLERWASAVNGEYHPDCCRFPKSCSIPDGPASPGPERVALNIHHGHSGPVDVQVRDAQGRFVLAADWESLGPDDLIVHSAPPGGTVVVICGTSKSVHRVPPVRSVLDDLIVTGAVIRPRGPRTPYDDPCPDCHRTHLIGEHATIRVPTAEPGGYRVVWEGCVDCWVRRTGPLT